MGKQTQKEIDLNLRHYIGHHSDVIRDVKSKISEYLKNPDVSCATKQIYSAIYNALTYYQDISDLSMPGESSKKTFLENTIAEFNKDFEYLSKKYNSKDPNAPKVIQAKGRVKSPISAFDKILEKISEYIHDGMDLSLLNNSLRDFIGLRIIVNPPPEIKALGKKAESDFCYQVIDDLLTYRGINRQINNQEKQETDYDFILVNTIHDPKKLETMKARPSKEGFKFDPDEYGVYIPDSRPEYIENYDSYVKDYRMFPKDRCYQRLHVCAKPYFSKTMKKHIHPSHILSAQPTSPSIEYQICTLDEDNFAEHGAASHTDYKGDRIFHRLGIPLFLKFDETTQKIRLTRMDEAMEEFYGYSFKDLFNINYEDFIDLFDISQRNDILAGISEITFDKESQEYTLTPTTKPVVIDSTQTISFIQDLLKNYSETSMRSFYEENGLMDNTVDVTHSDSEIRGLPLRIYFSLNPLSEEKSSKDFSKKEKVSNKNNSHIPESK